MSTFQFSSGDLVADRRAEYAEGLLASGDAVAAADLYTQALALAPSWAAGWFRLGEIRAEHGLPKAAQAFAEALRLDPADQMGAALRLQLLQARPEAETMPSAFVETLFDQYAPRFDHALVDTLAYRAPQLLSAQITGRSGRALDLGCGTGLMGAQLRPVCDWLEGWDISAQMLHEAEAKGLYDALSKCDLSDLPAPAQQWDLITAADVFAYLGALEQIVSWGALALAPGGQFAFTTEAHDGPEPLILRESCRYAHAEAYLRDLLVQAGFAAQISRAELRQDRGQPIIGFVVHAVRLATERRRECDGEDMALA
ncbi:hypothetical protein CKO11_15040 [Rhodobacter sp. TJ_12]|uniref:methyltransferase n=1 Tax=Rhodobacter sp. TJ_12 TaxID=2029399 RepID=UPI001CBE7C61|nr:methyltransferase [Rhodobacter sp. TJ_12]MBZ4023767.1 hypothetical protein [Rhodobacter sp. TJ_12]